MVCGGEENIEHGGTESPHIQQIKKIRGRHGQARISTEFLILIPLSLIAGLSLRLSL